MVLYRPVMNFGSSTGWHQRWFCRRQEFLRRHSCRCDALAHRCHRRHSCHGTDQPSEGRKRLLLAINLNANFIGNQTEGSFKAVSSLVKRRRTFGVVRTTVYGAGDKVIGDQPTKRPGLREKLAQAAGFHGVCGPRTSPLSPSYDFPIGLMACLTDPCAFICAA